MGCCSCFSSLVKKGTGRINPSKNIQNPPLPPQDDKTKVAADTTDKKNAANNTANSNTAARTFTFCELASATKNFRQECVLNEGGFGRVYKGKLENTGQLAAVKQLDGNGSPRNKEFLVEVLTLSLLHHQNIVNLIGYCTEGDHRLIVYDFMPLGPLAGHLLDIPLNQKPLGWFTRMKIASGAAKGLEYLHHKVSPSVIHRNLTSSNILLDEDFTPKLSDFGHAKLGPVGDDTYVLSSPVVETYGYCAPDFARTGQLSLKSDVYSYGVVLLELISGRRAIDTTRPTEEQSLVSWAEPMFKDPKRFREMADPLLQGDFPVAGLNQAVAVCAMCLQEDASARPFMSDVVTTFSFLSMAPEELVASSHPVPCPPEQKAPS